MRFYIMFSSLIITEAIWLKMAIFFSWLHLFDCFAETLNDYFKLCKSYNFSEI